jgi:hypothetical protein
MPQQQHTVQISDVIWDWATRQSAGTCGPATYIRDVLTEAMVCTFNGSPQPQPQPQDGELKKGKAVHSRCLKEMSEVFEVKHPDKETPFFTVILSRFDSPCHHCYGLIKAGEEIAMTNKKDWD